MARGWESKGVELQKDGDVTDDSRQRLTADEREAQAKRRSLELSRRRVVHDLESTQSEVHRTALENALHFLDDEIARLR